MYCEKGWTTVPCFCYQYHSWLESPAGYPPPPPRPMSVPLTSHGRFFLPDPPGFPHLHPLVFFPGPITSGVCELAHHRMLRLYRSSQPSHACVRANLPEKHFSHFYSNDQRKITNAMDFKDKGNGADPACTTSARSELNCLKAAPSLQHWLSEGAQALPGPGLVATRPQRWERSGLCCRWVCVWQHLPGQMAVALKSCSSFGPAQLPQQQFQCCKLFIALGMLFKPTLLMSITDNQRQFSVGAWGDGRWGKRPRCPASRHGQAASWKSGASLNRVKASISAHCGACTITEK